MQRFSLREAARRSSRSITTLRRYIRSGRLAADKRPGRFGPEYRVAADDLAAAGFELVRPPAEPGGPWPATREPAVPAEPAVPLSLFNELTMKHEQLLVQYGMMRAGGLRSIELREELEAARAGLDEARDEIRRLREQQEMQSSGLRRELYRANLELEGRALQISALHEKVRALELLTRSAPPQERIEEQFRRVASQVREIDRLSSRLAAGRPDDPAPDH